MSSRTPRHPRDDEHLKARGYYEYLDHPETGPSAYDGAPFKLSKTPGSLRTPAPLLGEHNEYVCKEILGMSDEEIAEALDPASAVLGTRRNERGGAMRRLTELETFTMP